MDEQPWQKMLTALVALATAAGTLMAVWIQLPPAQREMMVLEARTNLRRVAGRFALVSGHRAMGKELSGRKAEADAGYQRTEWLSRARDAL